MDDLFGAEGLEAADIDRLAEHLGDIDHAWPATLAELCDVLCHTWQRRGVTPEQAESDARLAAVTIARHFGGRQFYLPVGESLERALRDREIYQRWSASEAIRSLSRAYRLTETQIYDIVARQRKLRFERAQGRLELEPRG